MDLISWVKGKNQNLLIIIILIFLTLAFCIPVIKNIDKLGVSDWDYFYALNGAITKTILEYHQIPLWNPYMCGGMPLMGYPESSFPSLTSLNAMIFGVVVGLKIDMIIHLILGLIGMFYLLRYLKLSLISSFLGSIIFVLNSAFIWNILAGYTNFMGFAYLPLVFLFYLKAFEKKSYTVISSIFMVLMILEGGRHPALTTILLLIMHSVFLGLKNRNLKSFKIVILIFLFSFLLGSVKILPGIDWINQYVISGSCVWNSSYIDEIHDMFFIVPWMSNEEFSAYTGFFPMVLFLISIPVLLKKEYPLILTCFMFFLLMLGNFSFFAPWNFFNHIPPFNYFDVTTRMRFVFVFILSILVAMLVTKIENISFSVNKLNILKTVIIMILVFYITFDLATNDYKLLDGSSYAELPEINESEEFRQVENFPLYGALSSLYPTLLQNEGTPYCEFVALDSSSPISTFDDEDYTGEVYLKFKNGHVEYEYWSPNIMIVALNVTDNDILVINQNFDYNWKAADREVSLFRRKPIRLNRIYYKGLISTKVKPNDRKIIFYYMPYSFIVGLMVSTLSVIACFLYFFKKSLVNKFINILKRYASAG